jgi:hypothetical protein
MKGKTMKISPGMQISIPKETILIINNLFEIEKKVSIHGDVGNILRNVTKIREVIEGQGLTFEDPQGQAFTQTRADLEATISGEGTEDLYVVDVIKPIIRVSISGISQVVQKGIVIVESKSEGNQ